MGNQQHLVKKIGIAAACMAGGLALGFSIAKPTGENPSGDGGDAKKMSAVQSGAGDVLAAEMAALFTGNPVDIELVQRFDQLDLEEAKRLVTRLDGRDWLSGAEVQTLKFAFSRWAQLDPASAVDWVVKPGRARALKDNDFGLNLAYTQLTESDLETAIEKLETLAPGDRRVALGAMGSPFAKQDPERALKFFIENKSRDGQRAALSEWTKTDPLGAIAAAGEFDTEGMSYAIFAASEWAQHDPEKALDWVIGADIDPIRRIYVFGNIALKLAIRDPATAIHALNQIPAGASRQEFITQFVQMWAQDQPESAIAWAKEIPDPFARTAAIQRLVDRLSTTHPELAFELGESLGSSQQRDEAFGTHVEVRARTDVEEALAWAEALEDPERRLIAIKNSIGVLAEREATRAMEYVLAAEDQTEKRAMMDHMIENTNFSREQLPEMREVVGNMSREDERMTVDSLLEIQGDNIPGPVKLLLRTTRRLGPILDWMERGEDLF